MTAGRVALAIAAFSVAALIAADRLLPLPLTKVELDDAQVVLAADGSVLRSFADRDGVRRYRISVDEVSPHYLDALVGYEDRWFAWHFGVNPLALVRAFGQRLVHGRWVSGGSTLTMQVARILEPHKKSASGKLHQMFRAIQLELRFSKREILQLYLNYAPFGGNIEGVEAAARSYLGKSARALSPAEAALLAVLPQAPSRYRPDRHPDRARDARDKLLRRLDAFETWPQPLIRDALAEPLRVISAEDPLDAPLASLRARRLTDQAMIRTTIDAELQRRLQYLVARHVTPLGPATSAAVLVVDNRDLGVLAYLGAARYGHEPSRGYIDMTQAQRSPGSALKPLIYGAALDAGLIHAASPLFDVPRDFDGYRPQNFTGEFIGLVPADEALRRSLNVPAVDLLDRLGPQRFAASLRHAGIEPRIPGSTPSVAIALGGLGVTLEDLVTLFAALARDGEVAPLRLLADEPQGGGRPLLSPGAAWITREMLTQPPLPGRPRDSLAWKTGTSYGYRDAWAIGVSDSYTIGVWVGRADGTAVKGQFGAARAAPLLLAVNDLLPAGTRVVERPPEVTERGICWPMAEHCLHERTALTLDGVLPPIANVELHGVPAFEQRTVRIDPQSSLRLTAGCLPGTGAPRREVAWAAWLASHTRVGQRNLDPTAIDPRCQPHQSKFLITGLAPDAEVVSRHGTIPEIALRTVPEAAVEWIVNGRVMGSAQALHFHPQIGTNRVLALGNNSHAELRFTVSEG